jgi:pyrroline-5-carboxylate reductase
LNTDPKHMVDRLIDYRGTTAKGLQGMIEQGFREAVMSGLSAAHRAAQGKPSD